jgi:hypothetical protein
MSADGTLGVNWGTTFVDISTAGLRDTLETVAATATPGRE